MLLSSFRQALTLSSGLLFSWSCLIFSWVVVVGVCDFENVKRYHVRTRDFYGKGGWVGLL